MTFLHSARSLLTRDSAAITGRSAVLILLVQTLSLVAFLMIAFDKNRAYLLRGLDGIYMMTIAKQQHVWTPVSWGLTNNFLQSVGNVWFPLNTPLIPGYALSQLFHSGAVDPVFSYVIFSVELFIAVYVLCMVLRKDWFISALSAWGLVLSAMPVVEKPALYPYLGLVPHGATEIAWSIIALVLFGSIGHGRHGWTTLAALGVLGILLYLGVSQPASVILAAPALLLFGTSLVFGSESKHERNVKLVVGGVLVATAYYSGMLQFLYGLIKYTAAVYLGSEFVNNRQSMQYASIAFHKAQFGILGPILFWLGFAGSLLTAVTGNGKVRVIAIGTLTYMAVLLAAGVAASYTDRWRGPSPLYFEFYLWPLYAVYSTIMLHVTYAVATNAVRTRMNRDAPPASRNIHRMGLLVKCVGLACAPWLLFAKNIETSAPRDFRYPPALTPIVASLRHEIGLTPGSAFRGRVATLTGMQLPRAITWVDLHRLDYELNQIFGNDNRSIGLWHFDIPTLFEYSPYISPPFYLLTRTFFARPEDLQTRNVLTLRKFEPRILRLLGVRFVISDAPLENGARLRSRSQSQKHTLYLYEIDGANVGDFSPTQYRVSTDAREIVAELGKPTFNPRQQVLSNVTLGDQGSLVEATAGKLMVERGQLHISAESGSRSVLVLPLEYSHCLTIQSAAIPGKPLPRLFRANLLQTGVLFEQRLDATVTYFTGPFNNSDCRLKDAFDMDKLNIRRTAQVRSGKPKTPDQMTGAADAESSADSSSWQAYQERGNKRAAAGDLRGALEDYTAALSGSPSNPALYFLRGRTKMQVEDFNGAAGDFEAGLKLDPANTPLKEMLKAATEKAQSKAK